MNKQSEIERVLIAAYDSGFKQMKLRIAGFTYKLAPNTGRNVGAVYIYDQDSGEYYGKIKDSYITPAYGRSTNPAALDLISEAMKDPLQETIKWGRETGQCGVCGRALDNKESVRLGIGPICLERVFSFDMVPGRPNGIDNIDIL